MSDSPFVSRAGLKLEHALNAFDFDVTGISCADLGCNVGGFTDCLLQRGASHVVAVDTGYGTFAWKLRSDEHVTTLERTNALHYEPREQVDLVVIDLGWTPQKLALPAGIKWTNCGHIITLIKPHYELTKEEKEIESVGEGLSDDAVSRVITRIKTLCQELSLEILGETMSPIRGKKSSKKGGGNCEYLMLLKTQP
ncbi:MAG: TlyA family rRNA (cytidine-2'-O)-methyltransferase [Phycisphaerae bacterium]|jgi:23S rRNA (cytidine1920-2'-O)/16S rRNA (cytidine1409-2'-O)-methyltransferase|nr:TlyA family rRNA (cytidine-2'-O)-methyltransferase [Phycisphaerae bacterium]